MLICVNHFLESKEVIHTIDKKMNGNGLSLKIN